MSATEDKKKPAEETKPAETKPAEKAAAKKDEPRSKVANISLAIGGAAVLAVFVAAGRGDKGFSLISALIGGGEALLALLGTPLFALMGGSSQIAWFNEADEARHHLRYIGTTILNDRFADSPILVTIPLFTFVGYILAESKTPDRLVAAARAVLGWLPGGLAIVCVIASAVFTVLTGGSGVTIIAIGGLLYPALRKQGYSDRFSLGLVTTGGSVGLLLPYSLPLLVYCLVAHVDINKSFKAVLVPGALVIIMLSIYSAFIGTKEKVPRERPRLAEVGRSLWQLKWELFIPVILILGIGSGLTDIDESAGLVALYALVVQVWVHKDLSWKKDIPRIAKSSMSLAGAIILILTMANALVNYIVFKNIPSDVLGWLNGHGIEHKWQFLIAMNIFLLILGMLMEGFSAILIAVPLILPFVAGLGTKPPYDEAMSPFQLAMIFLLNLEIAYCVPPLGLNLFISSYRFNRPVVQMYRVVLPFAAILVASLVLVSYVPWFSEVLVRGDIAAERAKVAELEARGHADHSMAPDERIPPTEAWKLECVQENPDHPLPCSPEEWKLFPEGKAPVPAPTATEANPEGAPTDENGEIDYDALIKEQQEQENAAHADGGPAEPAP